MRKILTAFVIVGSCTTMSLAHYNILLPNKPWAQKGEKITFTYQFGHPFEHEMFDAPKPVGLVVLLPNGKKETLDVDKTCTKIKVPGTDGKKVMAWQFHYTPAERGDLIFVLKTPQIKIEEGEFIEDLVKVVLHVQTQNNWDSGQWPYDDGGIDILPNTRPYGILPGMVFMGQIGRLPLPMAPTKRNTLRLLHVEIEKFNEKPLKNPPPDELITFQTKPDNQGYFVTSLPEAGWWGITALAIDEAKKSPRITRRATLWVHVDEKK